MRNTQDVALGGITTEHMRERFQHISRIYGSLFALLHDHEHIYQRQPDPLRNTLAFYYGHTAAFGRKRMVELGLLKPSHEFDTLLDRGVSPDSVDEISHKQNWPSKFEIDTYKRNYFNEIQALFDVLPTFEGIDIKHPMYALYMAIEHEVLHIHTIIPLLTKLPITDFIAINKLPADQTPLSAKDDMVHIEKKAVTLGREDSFKMQTHFGWDNEFGKRTELIESFACSRRPITNHDVLCFIRDGGYQNNSFWRQEVSEYDQRSRPHPFTFCPDNSSASGYSYRILGTVFHDIPLSAPAHLNWYEANAIAEYLGGKMISEAQYLALRTEIGDTGDHANIEFKHMYPRAHDNRNFFGNASTWTEGDFAPISKNFETHPMYPDFSTEWFNSKHAVLRGTSWASHGHMIHPDFRDFMQKKMDYLASTYVVFPI